MLNKKQIGRTWLNVIFTHAYNSIEKIPDPTICAYHSGGYYLTPCSKDDEAGA